MAHAPIALLREIIDQEGTTLDLGMIHGLLIAGQIPLLSGIGVAVKRGAEVSNEIFPLSEIGQIDVTDKRRGWLTGLLIVGTVDAISLVIILSAFSNWHILRTYPALSSRP